jgi:hypothetical protein
LGLQPGGRCDAGHITGMPSRRGAQSGLAQTAGLAAHPASPAAGHDPAQLAGFRRHPRARRGSPRADRGTVPAGSPVPDYPPWMIRPEWANCPIPDKPCPVFLGFLPGSVSNCSRTLSAGACRDGVTWGLLNDTTISVGTTSNVSGNDTTLSVSVRRHEMWVFEVSRIGLASGYRMRSPGSCGA